MAAERASAELEDVLQTTRRLDQCLVAFIRGTVLAFLSETRRRTANGEEFTLDRLLSLALSPLLSKGEGWSEFFGRTEIDRRERISGALTLVDSEIAEAESASVEVLVANLEPYIRTPNKGVSSAPFVFRVP